MRKRKHNKYYEGIKKGLDEAISWARGEDIPVVIRDVVISPPSKKKKRLPPIHPGEILLKEFMEPLGLSRRRLAAMTRIPRSRINELVRGTRAISAESALCLARHFKTTARFWWNLQNRYDLETAQTPSRKNG